MEGPLDQLTTLHLQGTNTESATQASAFTEEPKLEDHHVHGDNEPVVSETVNSEVCDDGSLNYGCSHYRRRCKIRAPCCGEIFDCRHCHNEAKNDINVNKKERHTIPRHQVQQVICTLCGTEQEVQQMCVNCGVCMGKYFCGVCKLFDDDISKRQYHCDGCGICRIGGQENFFHCDKCRCCYSNILKDSHPCVEGAMHHDCPVCFEYLFDSLDDVTVMPCGHTIHKKCLKEMQHHSQYACPLCFKSVCDMSKVWEKLDMEIAATPMPDFYQNKSESSYQNSQHEEEVMSGARRAANFLLPDLNEDPAPDGEPSYVSQPPYIVYGGQSFYGSQGYNENPYGGEHAYEYECEPSQVAQNYSYVRDHIPEESKEPEKVDNNDEVVCPYKTDQDFMSREELLSWAQSIALEEGYVQVTKRSKKNSQDMVCKIWIRCVRGGKYVSVATQRKAGSKKNDCPFELIGVYNTDRAVWNIRVKECKHSHVPTKYPVGHPFIRRLSEREKKLIAQLEAQNMRSRDIFNTVNAQRSHNERLLPRDVDNAIQKIRSDRKLGATPMQVLLNLLASKSFVYYTREHPKTNVVSEVFFVHRHSFLMWRQFPQVLLIDSTYKTNKYRIPFVQLVGVTPTGQSFCVAHAFIERELIDNFRWVLERVQSMLEPGMEPEVIITDRDQALMNACNVVFPHANKYLCRFHIVTNIGKRYKRMFKGNYWKIFLQAFGDLCNSQTEEIYKYNYKRLYAELVRGNRKAVIDYITSVWLEPHKHMFVSAWTFKTRNFGETTTNRVESMHASVKRYIHTPNSSLDRVVGFLDMVVNNQLVQLKASFTHSLETVMNHHMIPLFNNLRGHVAHKALDLILREMHRELPVLRAHGQFCECHLWYGYGLPCACRLEKILRSGRPIGLSMIDPFWTKLSLNEENETKSNEEVDVSGTMARCQEFVESQPKHVRKSLVSKFISIINPLKSDKKPPVIRQDTRGRPSTTKASKQKPRDAATHGTYAPSDDLSQQSRFDPGRHSSYISPFDVGRHSTYETSAEPARVSSYVPSTNSERPSSKTKNKKDVLTRSRSTTAMVKDKRPFCEFPLLNGQEFEKVIEDYKYQIPRLFGPYISNMVDVKPDGNCGFRAAALGLGLQEHMCTWVREELLQELDDNERLWRRVFDPYSREGNYDQTRHRINWLFLERAPPEHWMEMPQAGLLIADRWGAIVHVLSIEGNQTFFPISRGPDPQRAPRVVTIVHVNGNHYIHATLEGNYPMPPLNPFYLLYRNYAAHVWENMYIDRLNWYVHLLNPNPVRNQINLVSDSNDQTNNNQ